MVTTETSSLKVKHLRLGGNEDDRDDDDDDVDDTDSVRDEHVDERSSVATVELQVMEFVLGDPTLKKEPSVSRMATMGVTLQSLSSSSSSSS